ncbi:hypothetical protein J4458_04670 [Candidatus Woesearchaeota archaeon]|nr:hypothetical protein [Candidatus Woesearchaeota archaeon]
MTKEKKVKVEAEIITRKNVSSGIGKGFGITVGIFLALIVIAVSCSILISSNADKIERQSSQKVQEFEQEVGKEVQRLEKQIEEQREQILDEVLPSDERAKKKEEEFKFKPDSIVNMQNGISLSLDDLKYEIKGENWGKITELTVTVLNNGNNAFEPKILVLLYDKKDPKEEWGKIKAEIEFDIFGFDVGQHITKKAITDIAFNDLNLTKKLQLMLVDAYDWSNRPIVVVEKEFIAK